MKNFDKKQLNRLLSLDGAVAAIIAMAAFGAIMLRLVNSHLPDGVSIPYCLTHDLLHLYCPFCGCTRAGLALLRLELWESFLANPLVLLFVAALVAYNAVSLWRIGKGRQIPDLSRFKTAAVILLVAFTLARNLLMIFFDFDTLGELYAFWQNVKGVY